MGNNTVNPLYVLGEDLKRLLSVTEQLPQGVQAMSQSIPGLVQTSLNLGVASLGETLDLTFALRSSVNQEKEDLKKKVEEVAAFYGASCTHKGDYPAWEYKKDSGLRDTMIRVYKQMYEGDPQVVAIHAGLECGLFAGGIPGLDAVSFGPEHPERPMPEWVGAVHCVDEGASVEFLLEALKIYIATLIRLQDVEL